MSTNTPHKLSALAGGLATLGRFGDHYMVHAAGGETVVPREVLSSNPVLGGQLFQQMRTMGMNPNRYVVGDAANSINPATGQPEFWSLGDLGKWWSERVQPHVQTATDQLGIGFAGRGIGALANFLGGDNPTEVFNKAVGQGVGVRYKSKGSREDSNSRRARLLRQLARQQVGTQSKIDHDKVMEQIFPAQYQYSGPRAKPIDSFGRGTFDSVGHDTFDNYRRDHTTPMGEFQSNSPNVFPNSVYRAGDADKSPLAAYLSSKEKSGNPFDSVGHDTFDNYRRDHTTPMGVFQRNSPNVDRAGDAINTQTYDPSQVVESNPIDSVGHDTYSLRNLQKFLTPAMLATGVMPAAPLFTSYLGLREKSGNRIIPSQSAGGVAGPEPKPTPKTVTEDLMGNLIPRRSTLTEQVADFFDSGSAEAGRYTAPSDVTRIDASQFPGGTVTIGGVEYRSVAEVDPKTGEVSHELKKDDDPNWVKKLLGDTASTAAGYGLPYLVNWLENKFDPPGEKARRQEEIMNPAQAAYREYTALTPAEKFNTDGTYTPLAIELQQRSGIPAEMTPDQLDEYIGTPAEPSPALANGGPVYGPGTGTSDSIPARLSDGEFVMTANAVNNAGGGSNALGAARMYEAMRNLENRGRLV